LLSIDRRDIINDDLGAITSVPLKSGRSSGLTINEVFWTIFLKNATFFTAANKNYLAGADTALSIDGLTKAEVAFMDQVDGDGKPIGLMPAIMLVPTSLSAIGTQLYKSLELRNTASDTKYPIANPHQGKFRVEVSRYLGNSRYTGSSQKAWYLMADPKDLPLIEVAFLNGNESPTIESTEADFHILGVQMRGYHDFGVALQDPSVARVQSFPFAWHRKEIIAAELVQGVRFSRPVKKPPENFGMLVEQFDNGELSHLEILAQTGLTHMTFYRRLREWRLAKGENNRDANIGLQTTQTRGTQN
jgi:hypothetical protein